MENTQEKALGRPIGGVSDVDGDGDGFVTGPGGDDNIPAPVTAVRAIAKRSAPKKTTPKKTVRNKNRKPSVAFVEKSNARYSPKMSADGLRTMVHDDMEGVNLFFGFSPNRNRNLRDLKDDKNRTRAKTMIEEDLVRGISDLPESKVLEAAENFASEFDMPNFSNKIFNYYASKNKKSKEGREEYNQIVSTMVRRIIHQWAESSNDNSVWSLAIQQIVAKEFGLSDAAPASIAGDDAKVVDERAKELLAKYPQLEMFITAVVRQQYANTQAYFKSKGIKEVTLHRGLISADAGKRLKDLPEGEGSFTDNAMLRPLSSFSADVDIADMFTLYQGVKPVLEGKGVRATVTVPVSQVFSTPFTGIGSLPEYEFVVLGKPTVAKFEKANEDVSSDQDDSLSFWDDDDYYSSEDDY